ncbi:MAG: glycosyltransferase family 2 protein [Bacteroidales bacterium]|nr:glycosyltransferase family 2 protein [Bacteroidales bacterium]MCF8458730.1 glycosyltransferase family 2 protein [Bacteroidales bacterium]
MKNTPQEKEKASVEFSVVVPVYNSEESLRELFLRTKATFEEIDRTFEVVFVEDSGFDNSWEVLLQLKKEFPENITAIQLAKNFGQHNAIFCGLNFIQGDFVITLDDDLQIPPEEIKKLIHRQEEGNADLVYADLIKKQHSYIRNKGSEMMKNSSKKLDDQAPGKGSSFKIFTRNLANSILNHGQNFIYIDEILLWYTKHIDFVSVVHEPRKYQKSNYTLIKLFRLFFNVSVYYTKAPLKMITYGGILLSIITFVVGIYFIIRKMYFNVPLGYTSIIVTVLFSTSIILFSLGVIGEYLNRMFIVQNKKPAYSIKSILKREEKE